MVLMCEVSELTEEMARTIQVWLQRNVATISGSVYDCFKKYDDDDSGTFDGAELRHMLRYGFKISRHQVSDAALDCLFSALDVDEKGEIQDMAEFLTLTPTLIGRRNRHPGHGRVRRFGEGLCGRQSPPARRGAAREGGRA